MLVVVVALLVLFDQAQVAYDQKLQVDQRRILMCGNLCSCPEMYLPVRSKGLVAYARFCFC